MIKKDMLYRINVIKKEEKIKLLKGGIKNTYGKEKQKLKQELEKLNK